MSAGTITWSEELIFFMSALSLLWKSSRVALNFKFFTILNISSSNRSNCTIGGGHLLDLKPYVFLIFVESVVGVGLRKKCAFQRILLITLLTLDKSAAL